MKKVLLLTALLVPLIGTACTKDSFTPAVQMELTEIETELAPYYDKFDLDKDDELSLNEAAAMSEQDLNRVGELTKRYEELYNGGISQNVGLVTSFLRGLGLPVPPVPDEAIVPFAALAFKRPRRQLVKAVKQLSPINGKPSLVEAGKTILSVVGLVDSSSESKLAAEKAAASPKG